MTACSSAAQAAVCPGLPPCRGASSSTHSRTRPSRASTSTSPVTTGVIAASHAIASAASPSSHAPPPLPVSDAAARRAAQAARTCAVHCSCRAESPSSRSGSASEMCAQAFTGCPARSGSRPAATRRRMLRRARRGSAAPGPVVFGPGWGGQRVQHLAHDRSALRGEITVEDAGALRRWFPAARPGRRTPRAGSSSGRSDWARSYISANSADRSASPSPAAAASPAARRTPPDFSGSWSVHGRSPA